MIKNKVTEKALNLFASSLRNSHRTYKLLLRMLHSLVKFSNSNDHILVKISSDCFCVLTSGVP